MYLAPSLEMQGPNGLATVMITTTLWFCCLPSIVAYAVRIGPDFESANHKASEAMIYCSPKSSRRQKNGTGGGSERVTERDGKSTQRQCAPPVYGTDSTRIRRRRS